MWLTSYPRGVSLQLAAGTAREVGAAGRLLHAAVRLPAGYMIVRGTVRGLLLAAVGPRPGAIAEGLLDPATEPAKIRAIFVHPEWARQGLGTQILKHCEDTAQQAGFRSLEMGSTLTGVPLYSLKGYERREDVGPRERCRPEGRRTGPL